jgi:hypothetical protein
MKYLGRRFLDFVDDSASRLGLSESPEDNRTARNVRDHYPRGHATVNADQLGRGGNRHVMAGFLRWMSATCRRRDSRRDGDFTKK